ncbi:aminotransferase class I/II-fold pyridoxal phosphate-dependent enzyme [Thiospirochaeta perfilievii]|uniref:aminotransferase class I/II-fold pyridoxal phosphate-dependent enzyme n=1 Tax=Thiospirochaeta perfilievii TaxID=252967 RepID=UPI001FEE38B8|nr:aminotransferase class I/II-fold pyridoxal phosphate-dependent enzyme [Thiospirochaeta perfilievii]
MNSLALNLNNILNETQAGFLLSSMGKKLYFPKGIVAQSAEASAKANKYNATAGMAFNKKKPLILSGLSYNINNMDTNDYITYAPTPGVMELRELWKSQIIKKNPGLENIHTSLPIVVPGLTSGISNTADLFLDPGDNLVIPDLFWGNYQLIFEIRKEVNIKRFSFLGVIKLIQPL